ncbi:MAG: FixH family protein [Deltaproteobacteria bacterium]|nr:FixH family protein [Deltaproteobacteria bacterium]
MRAKKLCLVAFLLVFIAGLTCARDYEIKKRIGEYEMEVRIDTNPPAMGSNSIEISIRDLKGKSITDAKVIVEYSMPPMPGMPPMNYKTDAILVGNVYKAKMNFSMAGPWNIVIRIIRNDATVVSKFNVDVKH